MLLNHLTYKFHSNAVQWLYIYKFVLYLIFFSEAKLYCSIAPSVVVAVATPTLFIHDHCFLDHQVGKGTVQLLWVLSKGHVHSFILPIIYLSIYLFIFLPYLYISISNIYLCLTMYLSIYVTIYYFRVNVTISMSPLQSSMPSLHLI